MTLAKHKAQIPKKFFEARSISEISLFIWANLRCSMNLPLKKPANRRLFSALNKSSSIPMIKIQKSSY